MRSMGEKTSESPPQVEASPVIPGRPWRHSASDPAGYPECERRAFRRWFTRFVSGLPPSWLRWRCEGHPRPWWYSGSCGGRPGPPLFQPLRESGPPRCFCLDQFSRQASSGNGSLTTKGLEGGLVDDLLAILVLELEPHVSISPQPAPRQFRRHRHLPFFRGFRDSQWLHEPFLQRSLRGHSMG